MINPKFITSDAWTPYTGVVYILAVNTDLLPLADAPKSWAELADPKWKGQIASARADGSGSAMQQLQGVLTIFGDAGWDKYGEIAQNFVLHPDSSVRHPQVCSRRRNLDGPDARGQRAAVHQGRLTHGYHPLVRRYRRDARRCGAGQDGPNPEGGKVFIDWAISKSTQETLVQEIGRRSVRTDVAGPEGLPNLTDINVVQIKSLADLGGTEAILEKWRAATSQ